jgi:hypothetical protein
MAALVVQLRCGVHNELAVLELVALREVEIHQPRPGGSFGLQESRAVQLGDV